MCEASGFPWQLKRILCEVAKQRCAVGRDLPLGSWAHPWLTALPYAVVQCCVTQHWQFCLLSALNTGTSAAVDGSFAFIFINLISFPDDLICHCWQCWQLITASGSQSRNPLYHPLELHSNRVHPHHASSASSNPCLQQLLSTSCNKHQVYIILPICLLEDQV